MNIIVPSRHTMAGAQKLIAEQTRQTRERKAREARTVAMKEAAEAIAKAERAAFDHIARKQLAAMFEAAMNRVERQRGGIIAFSTIERRICKVFAITPAILRSHTRSRELVAARAAVIYWARRLTKISNTEIGKRLGGRDHSTVRHNADHYIAMRAAQGRNLRPVEKGVFGPQARRKP